MPATVATVGQLGLVSGARAKKLWGGGSGSPSEVLFGEMKVKGCGDNGRIAKELCCIGGDV